MGKGTIKSYIKRILNFLGFNLKEIAGLLTAIGFILSVFVAWQKLGQYADQREENNFRSIIENLSNKDPDIRTAAATSMGTFIGREKSIIDKLPLIGNDKKFEEEAINILSSRLLIETDYSVSNAIRNSLLNAKNDIMVFHKILKLEQQCVNRKNYLKKQLTDTMSEYVRIKKQQIDSIKKTDVLKKYELYKQSYNTEQIFASVLGTYLQLLCTDTVVHNLQIAINNISNSYLMQCKIRKSYISHTLISYMFIEFCNIDSSLIENTDFYRSDIIKSTFEHDTIYECLFDFKGN